MPIEHTAAGTTVTGESISYFRLCVLKSAVGLELKGMKVRRGPVVWKTVAKEFGIEKPTKQRVYDYLVARVNELAPQQEHVVEEGGRRVRSVGGVEVT